MPTSCGRTRKRGSSGSLAIHFQQRLKRLASGGAIVVLATHDLDLADGLITRMAVVRGGKLLSEPTLGAGVRQQYRALVGAA